MNASVDSSESDEDAVAPLQASETNTKADKLANLLIFRSMPDGARPSVEGTMQDWKGTGEIGASGLPFSNHNRSFAAVMQNPESRVAAFGENSSSVQRLPMTGSGSGAVIDHGTQTVPARKSRRKHRGKQILSISYVMHVIWVNLH